MGTRALWMALVGVASTAGIVVTAAVAQETPSAAELAVGAEDSAAQFEDLAQAALPKAGSEAAHEEFQEQATELSQRLAAVSAAIDSGQGRQATREEFRRITREVIRLHALARDVDVQITPEAHAQLLSRLRALDAYYSADAVSTALTDAAE